MSTTICQLVPYLKDQCNTIIHRLCNISEKLFIYCDYYYFRILEQDIFIVTIYFLVYHNKYIDFYRPGIINKMKTRLERHSMLSSSSISKQNSSVCTVD